MLIKIFEGLKLFGFIAVIFATALGISYILIKIEDKWGTKYAYIAFGLIVFALCMCTGFKM